VPQFPTTKPKTNSANELKL